MPNRTWTLATPTETPKEAVHKREIQKARKGARELLPKLNKKIEKKLRQRRGGMD